MQEPLNASFIPKRNSNRPNRQNATQRVFLGTLIIQIIFFASLLATLGVFVYEKDLKKDLDTEILAFNSETASFSEEEMKKVIDLDNRMNQVQNRLSNTASAVAIFEAIEEATLQSVQIKTLKLERMDDVQFSIESEMETDTFDSVMFQRGVLERADNLAVTKISDLKLINSTKNSKGETIDIEPSLHFNAVLSINTSDIPHKPLGISEVVEEVVIDESATNTESIESENSTEETVLDDSVTNQENI